MPKSATPPSRKPSSTASCTRSRGRTPRLRTPNGPAPPSGGETQTGTADVFVASWIPPPKGVRYPRMRINSSPGPPCNYRRPPEASSSIPRRFPASVRQRASFRPRHRAASGSRPTGAWNHPGRSASRRSPQGARPAPVGSQARHRSPRPGNSPGSGRFASTTSRTPPASPASSRPMSAPAVGRSEASCGCQRLNTVRLPTTNLREFLSRSPDRVWRCTRG